MFVEFNNKYNMKILVNVNDINLVQLCNLDEMDSLTPLLKSTPKTHSVGLSLHFKNEENVHITESFDEFKEKIKQAELEELDSILDPYLEDDIFEQNF